MYYENRIWIGQSGEEKVGIYPCMANRHGLIAGATGTGKTTTLRVLAESFSSAGVPVFLADIKGDLSGLSHAGVGKASIDQRIETLHLLDAGFSFQSFPVSYWDVYAKLGLPLRTTISEMGPLLLSRAMELNDIQSDIMTILFKIADDEGLLLIDTKDLRSMITYIGDHAKEYALHYGIISRQSLGAIARALTALEADGGELFFGEPALNIQDWLKISPDGLGTIQLLDCQQLALHPTMYSTFLLWLMSELYEMLPEVGDLEKPKMVFFFDEAHMLFENASRTLLAKIEQVVKLIRSKGVGIYFITQTPADIPGGILSQLGNKIQHALHAYTPADQKAVKATAVSYRTNPDFDTYETLQNMGIGEALISVLDPDGVPTQVVRCTILPPQSQTAVLTEEERDAYIRTDPILSHYQESVDRDSAYEFLNRRQADALAAARKEKEEAAAQKAAEKEAAAAQKAAEKEAAAAQKAAEKEAAAAQKAAEREAAAAQKAAEKAAAAKEKRLKNEAGKIAGSVAGTLGREIGNSVGKSVGGSFGKKLGGNLGASLGRGIMNTLFKK